MNGAINGTTDFGYTYEEVENIATFLQEKTKYRPKLAIICGSGLGGLAKKVENAETFEYSDIPGFPVSTVPGHAGRLVFGEMKGKCVVLMQGRCHVYEGYPMWKVTVPVRVFKLMGITTLIVTNAAGGINREYNVGDIMILKDHLFMPGFVGVNPLVGYNDERFGPRFPAMSQSYDLKLRQLAKKISEDLGLQDITRDGVYCMLVGPAYESVTECKFLLNCGVDATGMSTVPEVMVARHCGMRCLALSLITNKCIMEYDTTATANHEEVLETGKMRANILQTFLADIVSQIEDI